jgi:uncharacterized protein (DUF934 family)
MPLIKNGRMTEDRYVRVGDDAALPEDVAVIITAERFLANPEDLLRRRAPTGIAWPNNRRVAELTPYLDRLALIALNFPTFKDGRGYSQARLLREHGFAGELRATGQILRDQFLFLVRAGFDALEVVKLADAEAFAATLARYSVFYQGVGPGRPAASRQRLARGTAVPTSRTVREDLHMR